MPCRHIADLGPIAVPAGPLACGDCAPGEHDWVHLRMCLTCGHIGCCNSSPSRHALAHSQATGHPVMRSVEPGEEWRWCYADNQLV